MAPSLTQQALINTTSTLVDASPSTTFQLQLPPYGLRLFFILFTAIPGQILLPAVIFTCLVSRHVKRMPALVNLLVPFPIFSIAVCLLLYSGHENNANPPPALCLAQASLMEGSLLMAALAALTFVIALRSSRPGQPVRDVPRAREAVRDGVLLATPATVFIIYQLGTVITAAAYPDQIGAARLSIVCRYVDSRRRAVTPFVASILLASSICLSFHMIKGAAKGLQIRRVFSSSDKDPYERYSDALDGPWLRMLVRLILLCFFELLAISGCVIMLFTTSQKAQAGVYFYTEMLCMAVYATFGTLPDIFAVWCFWRPRAVFSEHNSETASRTSIDS